jgi:hypothetical protein
LRTDGEVVNQRKVETIMHLRRRRGRRSEMLLGRAAIYAPYLTLLLDAFQAKKFESSSLENGGKNGDSGAVEKV